MLTQRGLNRALLARQMLLVRAGIQVEPAVRQPVGLQAQRPDPPHVGLWSRIAGLDHRRTDELLQSRRLVRAAAMRSTVHLLTALDALDLRPVVQPAMDRELQVPAFKSLPWGDADAALSRGRQLCSEKPLSLPPLGAALATEFPRADPRALAISVRNRTVLVQIPPRGRWRTVASTVHAPATGLLGRDEVPDSDPTPLIRRYLAAFGPATAIHIATWSGLRGIIVVLEKMADEFVRLADDRGRTLFDIPGGESPFVLTRNGQIGGTVLVDGYVRGTWRTAQAGDTETLMVRPFTRFSTGGRSDIEREALALLDFASSGCHHRVEFQEPQ